MPTELILYSTSGCHLCDVAKQLLHANRHLLSYSVVDIVSDDALIEAFATAIPVLAIAGNDEKLLYWPFEASDLEEFIA